jgi:Luciferase-like monooxygenase
MEALRVLKTIWTSDPVEFEGKFYRVPRSYIRPKPVQRPHPPIYIGAFGPPALVWTGTDADGWIGGGMPAAALAQMFSGIKATAQQAGRDPNALELIVGAEVTFSKSLDEDRRAFAGTPEQIAADIAAARQADAAEVIFNVCFDPAVASLEDVIGRLELLHRLAEQAPVAAERLHAEVTRLNTAPVTSAAVSPDSPLLDSPARNRRPCARYPTTVPAVSPRSPSRYRSNAASSTSSDELARTGAATVTTPRLTSRSSRYSSAGREHAKRRPSERCTSRNCSTRPTLKSPAVRPLASNQRLNRATCRSSLTVASAV